MPSLSSLIRGLLMQSHRICSHHWYDLNLALLKTLLARTALLITSKLIVRTILGVESVESVPAYLFVSPGTPVLPSCSITDPADIWYRQWRPFIVDPIMWRLYFSGWQGHNYSTIFTRDISVSTLSRPDLSRPPQPVSNDHRGSWLLTTNNV